MPRILNVLIVSAAFVSIACADSLEPLTTPPVTVVFATGRKVTAYVDHRTSDEKLWLRFGTARVQIVRTLDWHDVTLHSSDGAPLSISDVIELARQANVARGDGGTADNPPVSQTTEDHMPLAPLERRTPVVARPRTTAIRFDAEVANWDADIETDGLMIRLESLDSQGQPISVRGQANVQLWAIKRVEQDSQPRTRGRGIERIARSSVTLSTNPDHGTEHWIRLPFDTTHPEFNWDLSSFGIVHVELVVPGQGVFHHTLDGVRIRPFTPVRDVWHLHGSGGFFPVEPIARQ